MLVINASDSSLYDKSKWYRMEEREQEETKADASLVGSTVTASRVIVRCGYWISPLDLDVKELNDAEIRYVAVNSGVLNMRDVERVLLQVCGDDPNIDRMRDTYYSALRYVYKRVRDYWMHSVRGSYTLEHPINLRTFWYTDVEPRPFEITRVTRKQIGTYQQGGMTSGYWTGYEDYPPHPKVQASHALDATRWTPRSRRTIYIHPLDVS